MQTLEQYLDKLRTREIWGGACEVGRWAAAALLWSRQAEQHYELLWPPEDKEVEEAAEGDAKDRRVVDEFEMEVKFVSGGKAAEDQCRRGGQRGQTMSECRRMWSRCGYRGESQGGGTRGKSVPCGSKGRWEREAHVTGRCQLVRKEYWRCKRKTSSTRKYQRVRVRLNGTGGRREGWTCG